MKTFLVQSDMFKEKATKSDFLTLDEFRERIEIPFTDVDLRNLDLALERIFDDIFCSMPEECMFDKSGNFAYFFRAMPRWWNW